MEFKRVVGNRRSIRFYQPFRPVEKEKIQAILEAVRLQPHQANLHRSRKAVVVTHGETPDEVRDGLIDAVYNQPQAAQAPVMIVWAIDMTAWEGMRESLLELIDVQALNSCQGWTVDHVDNVVLKTPDFNVLAGDRTFAEWLTALEMGIAMGCAQLAAVDEGLGTQMLSGRRDEMRVLLGMPEHVRPAAVQLVGYPAEDPDAGGQRPRAPFGDLFFANRWGTPLERDERVVRRLTEEGMLQTPAPHPWRADEVSAVARMLGLPE